MTMWDVRRLSSYWQRVPPLRDLVADAIGFKDRGLDDLPPENAARLIDELPEFEP